VAGGFDAEDADVVVDVGGGGGGWWCKGGSREMEPRGR